MKLKASYKSFFLTTLSVLTAVMLLLPLGLKLEHAFVHHKEVKECTKSTKHFHSSVDHCDFIDTYFLPLVNFSFSDFNFSENIEILAPNFSFSVEFFQSFLNKLGVRGPPTKNFLS